MKRALLSTLIIGLVAPATAQAEQIVYHGTNSDGGALSFAAKHEKGRNRAVRPFLTGSVVLHCAAGDLRRSYNLDVSIKVSRKERFSRTVTVPPDENQPELTTIMIAGVFKHREQRAVGTLRAHATGAPFGDCDSGVVTWTTKGDTGSSPVGRATRP